MTIRDIPYLAPSRAFLLLLLLIGGIQAQDAREARSPDGKTEFHIFIALEKPGGYDRIAYRILHEGKVVIDTSFIGLDMLEQEPLLGEKAGLIDTKYTSEAGRFNGLTVEYLADGSLGRRIRVEARVFNEGVAFRYHFPMTAPQANFVLVEEYTEFAFPADARTADGRAVAALDPKGEYPLPFFAEEPGVGWVAVTELAAPPYPKVHLETDEKSVMSTVVARPQPNAPVAFEAHTPLTGPWRAILFGPDRGQLLANPLLRQLPR